MNLTVNLRSKIITRLQIIYVTGDCNWLKTCEPKTKIESKTIKKIEHFTQSKILFCFLYI